MNVEEVVGDSQQGDGLLEELGAALATPPPSNQPASPHAQAGAGGSLERSHGGPPQPQHQQQGGQQEAATPGGGGGGVAALSAAARAFAAECVDRGAQPHPQLLRDLNQLPDEAYTRVAPFVSPGHGGAVLGLPPDATPDQAAALAALVAGQGPAPAGGSASGDPHFLRTVHLDLSGHPGVAELLPELLLEGPHRLGQGGGLAGLALQGCQLPPDTLQKVFFDWRFLKAANRLRWLLLADNPLLGRAPAPAAPGPSQAGDTQAAAGGFLPPAQLLPLQWRVFAAAPLRLLDIRNTGFSDAALGYLMHQLARYPSPLLAAAAAPGGLPPGPEAPSHAGCRFTLQCLKLGPPADGGQLSNSTVACLAQVLQAAPQLQAVEVLGLSPAGRDTLLAAWLAAQQHRGQEGHWVETPDGGARFALSDEYVSVDAEQLPAAHQALQPPTPPPLEPQLLELDAMEVEVAQRERAWLGGGDMQQPTARHQFQERITAYVARAPQEGRQRRQQPRVPGAPPARQAGGSGGAGRPQQQGDHAAARGGGDEPRGGGGGGGERAAAAAGGGQRRRQAPGEAPRRRRRRTGGGGGSTPVHRGTRADELPQYGDACMSGDDAMDGEDDYYLATDEEASTPGGGSGGDGSSSGDEGGRPAQRVGGAHARGSGSGGGAHRRFCAGDDEHSSLSDHAGYDSDRWMLHYRKTLKSAVEQLKRVDAAAGEKARRCLITWNHADNATDRRRWINPSRDQKDLPEHLNALCSLKELFAEHGIRWHFPFPRSKRAQVEEWRRRQRREEQREEQMRGAAQAASRTERQQQGEARPHKRLRKQAELEAAALEDSQEADDEGGAAAERHATQRRDTQRVVLLDSESSEEEEGSSSSSEGEASDGSPLAPPPPLQQQQQQQQQGASPASQHAAPLVPSQVTRAAAAEVGEAVAAAVQQRLVRDGRSDCPAGPAAAGSGAMDLERAMAAAAGPLDEGAAAAAEGPAAEGAAAAVGALEESPAKSIVIPDSEDEQDSWHVTTWSAAAERRLALAATRGAVVAMASGMAPPRAGLAAAAAGPPAVRHAAAELSLVPVPSTPGILSRGVSISGSWTTTLSEGTGGAGGASDDDELLADQ
ncbi:hypothetical protein C2E20_6772 [Micractinium conductrix]|uniref:Uncharacterized protein n=1 Tax=Micractinium conductrix TaxID=554055 RepID=A0A2P6V6T7_9CHLO|nr:hypothetical protein C2E20_6772 [Micractinium conductrix]|eukprot:PSC69802.1 hypothetical protein C2E20_6772 [Micractinium conductrix]